MPEPQWRNPVRARLEAGDPVLALTVTTSNLEVAALAATLGFDFLWVEMEHSPITLETLRNIVLTTRGLPACVFARVPVVELWTAKRVSIRVCPASSFRSLPRRNSRLVPRRHASTRR